MERNSHVSPVDSWPNKGKNEQSATSTLEKATQGQASILGMPQSATSALKKAARGQLSVSGMPQSAATTLKKATGAVDRATKAETATLDHNKSGDGNSGLRQKRRR